MENVNFQASGDEIERALMDLGPLLGVTIKEELPEDPETAAAGTSRPNVENTGETGGEGENKEGAEGAGADSLDSPGGASARSSAPAARCVFCGLNLALLTQPSGAPKLMECLHSVCDACLTAKLEEKQASGRDFLGAERVTITCPSCRLQCQPANMIDQRFVLEKTSLDQTGANGAISGEQQCNSCEDTEPATSYCVDCAEFICDNCVHAHQRLKITKDHTIKSKEEAMAELQAQSGARNAHDMYCREHTQERLSLFCETCDRLTCRDCQLQHHRDHKYQFSTEMAAQARSSIAALLSEVSYKRVLLGSAMKVIRDRQQLIADKKKALVHEITQTVVKLTNAINTRGKQLVLRLSEVCDGKQRTLSEKKHALEQLADITDHCVHFVNSALRHGSDTALLYSKRCVSAHLQRIKSRRADIPNPEIPVRISLALDKLPELVRVLSSIGGIVVDGKVDGGGGAQGPYHPPGAPTPPHQTHQPHQPAQPHLPHQPHPPHQPLQPQHQAHQAQTQHQAQPQHQSGHQAPHSAVVALQQVAMHQSFVQNAGYLSPLQQGMRARPLRHPHVTSTTHPHHLHGMSEMNLRGLLNASGGARAPAPPAPPARHQSPSHHAMHHAYQQMMGAYASNAFGAAASSNARALCAGPRTPSPAPAPPLYPHALQQQQQQQQQHAKWHIPQHSAGTAGGTPGGEGGTPPCASPGAEYKITLARQQRAPPTHVTSTNPKTPSPSLNGGVSMELDKVCAESVQDLMATIAKLDSNGVQVVAEAGGAAEPQPQPSPAPHVHSSTGPEARGGEARATPGGPAGPGDPNEDWCAVCMDGGELMCCDKCPKVFHQYCHIPTIEKLPDETETWQCLLCVNFAELPPEAEEERGLGDLGELGELGARQQKLVERITLELYCQYEASLPFREAVPPDNAHYHSKIARPVCLDMIRLKLQPRSPQRYTHVAHFVADCRLLFHNAFVYNPVDSQIYKDAKRLEQFFEAQLVKWLPEYAGVAWGGEVEPPQKRMRID